MEYGLKDIYPLTVQHTRFGQQKMPLFFRFRRKLVRTKTKKSIDKAIAHGGHTVSLLDLVFLTRTLTGVVSNSSFILNPLLITLPPVLRQLPF